MPEAATVGVLQKKIFLNFAKFTGNSCAWGNTCGFCKIFKNTFFTEQLRTTASESGYRNNEARDIDYICCRELDHYLLLWLKSQSTREESHHATFMGICPTISHNKVGFIFLFLVLIKWNEREVSHPRGLRASTQTYHEQGGIIYCVWSVCGRLSQWWLVFVLLGFDATLSNGCGIW